MEFYSNHKLLFWSALVFFLFLTLQIAILPAIQNQQVYQPLPDAKPLTKEEKAGKEAGEDREAPAGTVPRA